MRLLLVDDHEVVRRGVRSLLFERTDYEVCGEAVDGHDAVEKARDLKPDVVVMDVSMPRLNGLEATRLIRSALPACEVVVLSQHDSPEMVRQALKAGARAYVVKSSVSKDLFTALSRVARHEIFVPASISSVATTSSPLDVQEILQRSAAFERALHASEKLYRTTFELAAVGVSHVAPSGRWLRVNRKLCDIVGYTESELLNTTFQEMTHPDDLPADLAETEKLIQGTLDTFSMEKRYIRKDKSLVWVNLTVSCARDADGKLKHFISVVEDISERKRVEEALRDSQAQLTLALESSRTAMFDWDPATRRGTWNPQLAVIYGFNPQGKYITADEWNGLFHPEDSVRLAREYDQIFRDPTQDSFKFEFRMIRPDGEVRWILSHGHIVRDASGTAVRMIGTHADITETKQVAEVLHQRQAELSEAQRLAKVGSWHWTPKTNSATWSPEINRILGRDPDAPAFNHSSADKVFSPESWTQLQAAIDDALKNGTSHSLELELIRSDGEKRFVILKAEAQRDSHGAIVALHGTLQDITDRKHAEKSRSLLAAIVDSSDDAIISKNLDGTITSWNQSAERMFGYSASEAVGRPITLIIPLDRREEEVEIISRLRRGERIDHFETVRRRKDGTLLELSLTVSPLKDAESRVIGASKVARDISTRKSTERALATGTKQQKALFHLADELHRAVSRDQVYNAAFDALFSALGCDRASILLLDDSDGMRFVSWRGLSDGYRAAVEGHSAWKSGEPNPQPICIPDIDSTNLEESLTATIKKEGIGALAFIPLVSNGKLIGKFMTYFNAPHGFSHDEIELNLTIARQLAFAIDRMRNEQALRRSEALLAAEATALAKLNECSSRLWHVRSLHEGLDEMLAAIIELLGADKGNIQLLDPQRGVLTIVAQRGFDPKVLEFFREVAAGDDCACGRALRERNRIIIKDVETDPAYKPYLEPARAAGYRGVTSIPLVAGDGSPLGILSTHFAFPHEPMSPELRALDLYASHAADFIQRCKIEEALQQSEARFRTLSETLDAEVRARTRELEEKNADLLRQSQQVRELSQHLLRTQDEERRHIARELHDSAGQTLTVLGLNVAQIVNQAGPIAPALAKGLEEVQDLVQQVHGEIRTTSYLLHPPLLDEAGLSSALNWYVQGLSERSGLAISLDLAEDFGRLPGGVELVIFRVVQECLTNVHRHSGSKTASIRLCHDAKRIFLEVRDQGSGLPPDRLADVQRNGSGVGIRGMQERLRQLGGEMKIDSDGSGTCVRATIPMPKETRSADVEPFEAAV